MKEKRFCIGDRAAVLLGLCLLLGMGLFALLWPHPEFIDAERRYRASAPSVPSLTDWKTDRETEAFLADRVPLRNVLVAADSLAEVATARRTELDAWPVAGAFLEKPVTDPEGKTSRRLQQFESLSEKIGAKWQLIVPRSHGYLLRKKMNSLLQNLYDQESRIYDVLASDARFLDVLPDGTDAAEVYYRTDHHWTLQGAWLAYAACCRADGLPVYSLEEFKRSSFPGFFGTTRSRSGLPAFRGDMLECAEPMDPVILTADGETFDHLIFPGRAETYDGYAVYLDGNHGMTEILNPAAPGGTLLVFKDSFANCLLPLLSADYRRIVAVDARYYTGNFSRAAEAAGAVDSILFVYSADSLINDTSLAGKVK